MFETLKGVAAVLLLLALYPTGCYASVVDGAEWLEPGESELSVKAVLTTKKREGQDVTVLDYSPETMANLEKLVHQRTRKLVVYYCGNLNRQLERFAKEHAPFVCKRQENAAAASAFEVGSAIIEILTTLNEEVILNALEACKGVENAKEMHKEHAPLFKLVCVNQYLAEALGVNSTSETLSSVIPAVPVAVVAALDDLKSIMDCPQEMVRLARRQLETEYQHDGIKQMVAANDNKLDAEKAREFMEQNPVPTRAQFRLMEKQEKLEKKRKQQEEATMGGDKQEL